MMGAVPLLSDQRRGPAAVYLAHRRPDKPKTQQREQADGDDEPSPMKVGVPRPQLAENVVVPIGDHRADQRNQGHEADENAGDLEHV